MFKKYLYAVILKHCELTFPDNTTSPFNPVIFCGRDGIPAVFTSQAMADKQCAAMRRLFPENDYFVYKFLPGVTK